MSRVFNNLTRVFALVLGLGLATLATDDAHAVRGGKGGPGELRLRASLLYANSMYTSRLNNLPENTSLAVVQPGGRAELEGWLGQSRFGFLLGGEVDSLDYQGRPDNFRGKPLYLATINTGLGWRIFGQAGVNQSQTMITLGPSLTLFPNVTTFSNGTYDRVWARMLGARAGARSRLAITSDITLEVGAFWTRPYRIVGEHPSMSLADTRSYGGAVLLDFHMTEGVSLGVGCTGAVNRVVYSPDAARPPNAVDFNVLGGFASILFWL